MQLITANGTRMNYIAASSVAIGAITSSTTAKNVVLASTTALNALDASPLAKTISIPGGTVTGKGFVISYSLTSSGGGLSNVTANGSHLFFTSKIALSFTQGYLNSTYNVTGSGNMKYILGS